MSRHLEILRLANMLFVSDWTRLEDREHLPKVLLRGGMFNPFESLSDAMTVAQTIGGLTLCQLRKGDAWTANFDDDCADIFMGRANTPSEAITLAAIAYLDSK